MTQNRDWNCSQDNFDKIWCALFFGRISFYLVEVKIHCYFSQYVRDKNLKFTTCFKRRTGLWVHAIYCLNLSYIHKNLIELQNSVGFSTSLRVVNFRHAGSECVVSILPLNETGNIVSTMRLFQSDHASFLNIILTRWVQHKYLSAQTPNYKTSTLTQKVKAIVPWLKYYIG